MLVVERFEVEMLGLCIICSWDEVEFEVVLEVVRGREGLEEDEECFWKMPMVSGMRKSIQDRAMRLISLALLRWAWSAIYVLLEDIALADSPTGLSTGCHQPLRFRTQLRDNPRTQPFLPRLASAQLLFPH